MEQVLLTNARREVGCPGRFAIEPLEERIAPASSLIDMNVALNFQLTGPMKHVDVTFQNIYVIVSHNVIQASTGGTLVGVVG